MTGQYDENLILGYVEGDLTPEDRQRVEALMQNDPALRELLAGLVADRAAVRALPREAPPAHLHEDVMQQLERSMLLGDSVSLRLSEERHHARRFHIGRVLMYSGLAAIVLITGGLVFYTLTDMGLVHDAAELQRSASVTEDEGADDGLALGDMPTGWVEGEFSLDPLPDALAARESAKTRPNPAPTVLGQELDLNESMQGVAATVEAERTEVTSDRLDASQVATATPEPTTGPFGVDRPAAAMEPMALTLREEQSPAESDAAIALKSVEPALGDDDLPVVEERLSFFRDAATAPAIERLIRSETAAEPVRIHVRARDTEDARRDVVAWATRNGAVVLDGPEAAAPTQADPFAGFAGGIGAGRDDQEPRGQRVIVQLTHQEQVPQLLAYLGRDNRQASLVQTPAAPVDANYRVSPRRLRAGQQYVGRTAEPAAPEPRQQAQSVPATPPSSTYAGLAAARPLAGAEPDRARRPEAVSAPETWAMEPKMPGGALADERPHPRAEAYRGYGEAVADTDAPAAEAADEAQTSSALNDASNTSDGTEPRSLLEDPALLLQNILPVQDEDALRVPIYIQAEP